MLAVTTGRAGAETAVLLYQHRVAGIGEAMARRFHAEGANIVLHGLEEAAGQAILEELEERAVLQISDLADLNDPWQPAVEGNTDSRDSLLVGPEGGDKVYLQVVGLPALWASA